MDCCNFKNPAVEAVGRFECDRCAAVLMDEDADPHDALIATFCDFNCEALYEDDAAGNTMALRERVRGHVRALFAEGHARASRATTIVGDLDDLANDPDFGDWLVKYHRFNDDIKGMFDFDHLLVIVDSYKCPDWLSALDMFEEYILSGEALYYDDDIGWSFECEASFGVSEAASAWLRVRRNPEAAARDRNKQMVRGDLPDDAGTYFVEALGTGLIKIGCGKSISKRLQGATTFCPVPIVLLGWLPDEAKEQECHKKFAHLREHGEWFRDCDELRGFIAENCNGARKRAA